MRPTKKTARELAAAVAHAVRRRLVSCIVVASVGAMVACAMWASPLWAMGLRSGAHWSASLAFGLAVGLLLSAESAVLSAGYFAGRQPWRRLIVTRTTLGILGGLLGGIMGATCGATRREAFAVAAASAGALVGCRHGVRIATSSRAERFVDLNAAELLASRLRYTLECAAIGAVATRWIAEAAGLFSSLVLAAHAAFAVELATAAASAGVAACLLEPLNFEVICGSDAVAALLAAAEVGDAEAADDARLRRAAKVKSGKASGWYATSDRDPVLDGTGDASAPLWRRDFDAQRVALWRGIQGLEAEAPSWLAPPPPLALASGGLVLGSPVRSLAERFSKFLAVSALANEDTARRVVSAGDVPVARALRACLLVLDGFTVRLMLAAHQPALTDSNAGFASIVAVLHSSKRAQQYFFHDPAYLANQPPDFALLEVVAVANATRATFALVESNVARIPVALCSLLAARRALRGGPSRRPADLRQLEGLLDATLDRFCLAFADHIPRFAYPALDAPDLQRRVDALVNEKAATDVGSRFSRT